MIQRYPLTWPEGWKRTRSMDRQHARFVSKERKYRASTVPGNQGTYYTQSKSVSVAAGVERVLAELGRMYIHQKDIVISTNVQVRTDGLPRSSQAEPQDPGVAVYWQEWKKDRRCMAVDRYYRVADNLAAIAATLDAMRSIERHGGAEILDRAFTGFAQLPERAGACPWRRILGFELGAEVSLSSAESAFLRLAKIVHPDHGGTDDSMRQLIEARDAARRELGG